MRSSEMNNPVLDAHLRALSLSKSGNLPTARLLSKNAPPSVPTPKHETDHHPVYPTKERHIASPSDGICWKEVLDSSTAATCQPDVCAPMHSILSLHSTRNPVTQPWLGHQTKLPDQSWRATLITGATGEIGREAARALAARKARLVIACQNPTKMATVAQELR